MLAIVFLVDDFLWLTTRSLWYAPRQERRLALFAHCWFFLAKWLPQPRIRLSGLRASADELYNGNMSR